MTSSLDAALTGMLEHQRNLELISNNLANVSTTGYKRAAIHFRDIFTTVEILNALGGTLPEDGTVTTSAGVESTPVERIFDQGPILQSPRELDFAISGDGLFQVRMEDGTSAFTRDGVFSTDVNRNLVTADGLLIDPPIQFPELYSSVQVDRDGTVSVLRPLTDAEFAALPPGELATGVREVVGQFQLARFEVPSALDSIGANLYIESVDSQPPIPGAPGEDGFGRVLSGWQEGSNVQLSEEMTSMVVASRAYQINLRAYQTIEEMLTQANNLA